MYTVTMRRAEHIRSSSVDSRVNHKGCGIEQPNRSSVEDLPAVAHLDQVGCFDLRERHAEWVHPEGGGIDRVAEGNVSCHACNVLVPIPLEMETVEMGKRPYLRRSHSSRKCGMPQPSAP